MTDQQQPVGQPSSGGKQELVNQIIQGQIGSPEQFDRICDHMDEYFKRFPSYFGKFTELEWYHIFLDFSEKFHSQPLSVLPPSPVETKVAETALWKEERQRLWYFWDKVNHFVDQLWNDGIVNGKVDDKYVKRVCQVQQVGHTELSKYQNPYDHHTTEAAPSPVGEWTDDMVRSYVHYCNIGDWNKCTDEQMGFFKKTYREDHPNLVPAPSRAGEISPVLPRWVKARERKCDCCGTINRPDDDGIFRECSNCMNEFEPSKDSPVGQEDQWHPQDYSGKNATTEQPAHVPDPKGEIPEEIMTFIKTQVSWKDEHDNAQSVGKELMIALYHKMMEGDVTRANTRYSDIVLDLRKAEKEISTLTQQRDEVREELEQVKLSFHQASEVVKQLTAELVAK